MNIKNLVEEIELNPKKLFLIDGSGAAVTAFMLGVVLVKFESFFGIPPSTLYLLAAIPILFVIYDLLCFYKGDQKLPALLKGIAIANLLYCCISIGFAFNHSREITMWGWLYIINEIIIIVTLVVYELKVANKLSLKT